MSLQTRQKKKTSSESSNFLRLLGSSAVAAAADTAAGAVVGVEAGAVIVASPAVGVDGVVSTGSMPPGLMCVRKNSARTSIMGCGVVS